ncbi:hypothetical protein D9M69_662450 [compost metagenome]
MDGKTRIALVRAADHCLHLDAVTTGQQMPERDIPHRGVGGRAAAREAPRREHAAEDG